MYKENITDYTNEVGPSEKQNSKGVGCDFYLLVVVCTCATPPAFEKQMLAGNRLGLLGYIEYILDILYTQETYLL